MTAAAQMPAWAVLITAALVLAGAVTALIGSIGLLRLESFYRRAHAPTLGATLGIACVLLASTIYFSVSQARPAVHEVLIAIFAFTTTPVTLLLLVRAALYRDRSEEAVGIPPLDDSFNKKASSSMAGGHPPEQPTNAT